MKCNKVHQLEFRAHMRARQNSAMVTFALLLVQTVNVSEQCYLYHFNIHIIIIIKYIVIYR
jgi:hypothetical protein